MRKLWHKIISFFKKKKPDTVSINCPAGTRPPKHFKIALAYLGTKEIYGREHNNVVVNFFKRVVGKAYSDETAWCAAFVGSCLVESGLASTKALNARSYTHWGEIVKKPRRGDVLVFWRESPKSWKGHVGFYYGETEKDYIVLGGNQNNAVSLKKYPKSRLLGIRRHEG
jgi:uncharacterized protein (TIGR02594 family)